MINAEKLTFGFNSTLLLQNVSFTLEENCHCALIGSNGTGKTTLTNLIRQPDRYIFDGKLKLEGVGRIGYVSQFALREGNQTVTVYDYLCRDFLALELEMQKKELETRIARSLEDGDCAEAQRLCSQLAVVVEHMQ